MYEEHDTPTRYWLRAWAPRSRRWYTSGPSVVGEPGLAVLRRALAIARQVGSDGLLRIEDEAGNVVAEYRP